MEIDRSIEQKDSLLILRIRASFSEAEAAIIKRFGLSEYYIKTKEGPLVGRDSISKNSKLAYRAQLGRVKNRWNVALVRTTGYVFIDSILKFSIIIYVLVKALIKLVFGRRRTLSDAMHGITIQSKRIEAIKESEFFVLLSLASVNKSIQYILSDPGRKIYRAEDLEQELEGLDFAGAGSVLESEYEALETVMQYLPVGSS